MNINEACVLIEEEIKAVYREYSTIYQAAGVPEVELIYGVRDASDSRLFLTSGPIVAEKQEYEASGVGRYMANYLAGKMYRPYLNIYQCVVLAAYVLLQAKEHVEGCGGDSHIAVLGQDGVSGMVDQSRVEVITDILRTMDMQSGELLLSSADLRESSSKSIEDAAALFVNAARLERNSAIEKIKSRDLALDRLSEMFGMPSYGTRDLLRFLMPSTSHKSADQQ